MTGENHTVFLEFLLLELPIRPGMQDMLYAVFLAIYVTTVLGNLLIIILIYLDSHLHMPMYFFLSNLSFSDLCFSSVTMPIFLHNMQRQVPSIPYAACLTQMYFFLYFGDLESFLLVAMAYDRYVAICFPLHYTSIMSPRLCLSLVGLCWVLTTFHAMLHTLLMARVHFCENKVIPHFFCELSALLKLACSDTQVNELVLFITGGLVLVIPFLLIILSYARIVSSILRVPSARGIHKAFSTCGSHVSVVSLFYGTVICVNLCPSADNFVKETVMFVVYTVVTPMLNPFIYSLRNRDMKGALGRVFFKKKIPFCI
nr:olfactory receptor-like protein DTMT [Manis javanica]